ncbi:hypothetical protein B4N89_28015 [Embleya scabrispora]|uniref:HTH araC/xylS-type domain-containing protein n=1 Tax=Embleya scabrispora TaxID=159449 RepID=A0A1T3P5P7_9ACTN|nr:hypothetical protein [Embleya scabrispora]OPC84265.1 hypothetical protein B4N89_28015 [Embleya scabrispora]
MTETFVRLTAAVAAHRRLHATCPDPISAAQTPRDRCRAAAAEVRTAVANAARDRVPVEAIARATGFSPRYIDLILDRDRD